MKVFKRCRRLPPFPSYQSLSNTVRHPLQLCMNTPLPLALTTAWLSIEMIACFSFSPSCFWLCLRTVWNCHAVLPFSLPYLLHNSPSRQMTALPSPSSLSSFEKDIEPSFVNDSPRRHWFHSVFFNITIVGLCAFLSPGIWNSVSLTSSFASNSFFTVN